MKRLLQFAISLVLLFVAGHKALGQEFYYRHFGVDEGLSHYSILDFYQDERDLIWVATSKGVNLYMGHDFIRYKISDSEAGSVLCDEVLRITGDRRGKVWFQTVDGVAEFDIATERITPLCTGAKIQVHYADGLYIAQNNTLSRICEGEDVPVHALSDNAATISAMLVDTLSDRMVIGTENRGLWIVGRGADGHAVESNPLPHISVTNVFRDSAGRYWVATLADGVYIVDDAEGTIRNLRHNPHDEHSLSSDFVRSFCETASGEIYIGTFNGLNRYNAAGDNFVHLVNMAGDNGIKSSSIWGLLCDKQGNIWVGSFFEGIYRFNPMFDHYRKYSYSPIADKGLCSPIVSGITEDENGLVYIATEVGGFCRYDRRTGQFRHFQPLSGSNGKTSYNNIKGIYYDRDRKALWLGTHMGGLFRFDIAAERLTQYTVSNGSLPSDIVRQITGRNGELILATHGGVCLFNPEQGSFRMLPGDNVSLGKRTGDICLSRDGKRLWFSDYSPILHCYDFDICEVSSYTYSSQSAVSPGNSRISHLFEDSCGRLWCSTENDGVYVMQNPKGDFIHRNDFTGKAICGVAEIAADRFIVVADNGFTLLDLGSNEEQNHFVRSEIPLQMINADALYLCNDGEIFIGGIDGMVSFFSPEFSPNLYPVKLFPLVLTIDGQHVTADDDHKVFDMPIDKLQRLRIPPRYTSLSLQYAITDYSSSLNISYRLRGIADNWIPMPADNTIQLTNLPPKNYELEVQTTDSHGNVRARHTLQIRIVPPWYDRWWAWVLFAALFAVILYLITRIYSNHIKLHESLKYERQHSIDIEEQTQGRLRFFTSIAHEFRTPLTIIVGHMEALLQTPISEPWVYKRLLSIHKNSITLRDLISELLDFRSHTQGHMKIHATENDLVAFLRESYLLFNEYATLRNMEFTFDAPDGKIMVWYDARQMQKVVNNLLSNALKYTKNEGGGIMILRVSVTADEAVFSVEDNGCGIAPGEIDNIFQRFYRADNVTVGSGIGLALTKGIVELHGGRIEVVSVLNSGTTFTVHLPLGCGHLGEEQIHRNVEQTRAAAVILPPQSVMAEVGDNAVHDSEVDTIRVEERKPVMLVVEDNDELRAMFAEIFTPYYHVETAVDGVAAMEKMRGCETDIIVSDIAMPRMDGIELCKAVKNNFDTCHIPVVLLTAHISTDNNIQSLAVGADDYITKPFSVNVLISRCNNLINSRVILKEKFSGQGDITPRTLAHTPIDQAFIDRAVEIVTRNMDNADYSINSFAREMCVARTKLFMKLKAITGQTPYEFMSGIRLRRAAELLRNNGEYNVSEISDIVGFKTLRHFSKTFKDKYGMSPLRYRNHRDNGTILSEEQ